MRRQIAIGAASALLIAGSLAYAAPPDDLATAKSLYGDAAYEDALAALNRIPLEQSRIEVNVEVNEYRALCLLALGRDADAEPPLQQIVMTDPQYTLAQGDVSPRLVELFHTVRKRTLPAAAKALYLKAKESFEAHRPDAASQFETLVAILNDGDVADRAGELADMKALAEGFLTLAQAQAKAAQAAAAPAIVAQVEQRPAAPPDPPRIYSVSDSNVRPPIERERAMPTWNPPAGSRQTEFRGMLRVVIDEQGHVESAVLVEPVHPSYNAELIKATKAWRYDPAVANGNPVKYLLTMEIVLRGAGG